MMKKVIGLLMVIAFTVAMLTACGEPEVLNPEADNMTDYDWSKDICDTAIQKMLDEGAIKAPEGDLEFNFTTNGDIRFETEEGYTKYESEDFELNGKQIWARSSDQSLDLLTIGKNTSGSGPEYYPDSLSPGDADKNKFANTKSECQYFIVTVGFVSSVNEKYYMGGIDRQNVSTFVFIFDAVEKEVVHIEMIDADYPGFTTDSPIGKTDKDGAFAYINGL